MSDLILVMSNNSNSINVTKIIIHYCKYLFNYLLIMKTPDTSNITLSVLGFQILENVMLIIHIQPQRAVK